ncbi:MAG: hypothetical protein HZB13_16600 [Acidobacteria bacterium]|nr:hypothetical protein [Acidobacteriota bacterium]
MRELAEQLRVAKMRKQTYVMGELLLTAIENGVHELEGYSRFEDWYMKELDEPSCPRALWDILKVERVRRTLDLSPDYIQTIDISKAKKISQLCDKSGKVQSRYPIVVPVFEIDVWNIPLPCALVLR